MNGTIREAMARARLTPSESKAAEYILAHREEACYLTAEEMAGCAGVSDTSVIRLAKRIGFDGYSHFQKAFREEFRQMAPKVPEGVAVPSARLAESVSVWKGKNLFFPCRQIAMQNMESVYKLNGEADFEKACDLLITARRRFVIGTRSRMGFASFFSLILNQILSDVSQYTGAMTPFDFLAGRGADDAAVFLSFPRYSALDEEAARMAHDQGMKILLLTDKISAPLVRYSDVTLLVRVDSNTYFNSYTALQFLCEMICARLSARLPKQTEERLDRINAYLEETKQY